MQEVENPSTQERETREVLNVGELYILSTRSSDILVSASELEETLRGEEEPDFRRHLSSYMYEMRKLPNYVRTLRLAKLNIDLKLHVHLLRKSVKLNPSPADLERGLEGLYEREYRHVCLGTLQIRSSQVLFNGVELSDGAFEKWLDVCLQVFWKDTSFTPERATELARMIGTHLREAERRSLETLRRTLGDDVAERVLRNGKVVVRSPRGEEYIITDSAEVYRRSPDGGLRHVCVRVEGGEDMPKYDLVLAKYLVIRDRPELIRDHERLLHEIDEAHRQLEEW